MSSITRCLEEWAGREPDRLLFGFIGADGRQVARHTYQSFLAHSGALATRLQARQQLRKGDRVLLVYPQGLDLLVAFFACARIGLIAVPGAAPGGAGQAAAMARLLAVAKDCAATAVLSTGALCDMAERRRAEGTDALPLPWIATEGASDAMDGPSGATPDDPHEVLLLQYTSGSTGQPRGVMVSHDNVIHNARATLDHRPVGVSWLPQYHDMGLIGYGLFPVVCGGTSHGLSALDFLKRPALWLQAIGRYGATYASSPNFGFEYCLRTDRLGPEELAGIDLRSLRVLMNAAEPVRPDTRERFIYRFRPCGLDPAVCVATYGLAENTLAATHGGRRTLALDAAALRQQRVVSAGAAPSTRVASCGRPLQGVRLCIVESATRRALAERRIGEIWLAGDSVCSGYWQHDPRAQNAFGQRLHPHEHDEHDYLRTGDLGFVDDGELFVCGRAKDLIIVRGANHYPQDIEAAVEAALPALAPGSVAAFNGDDDTLVIVVELRHLGSPPQGTALAHAVRRRCGVEPDTILFVPAHTIVRTTSGKTARAPTRERIAAGQVRCLQRYDRPAAARGIAALRQRLDQLLAGLGSDAADATLAELGIDSLTLTELLLELEQQLCAQQAADLAEQLDTSLLQRLTLAQLQLLLDRLEDGSAAAMDTARQALRYWHGAFERGVVEQMRADAALALPLLPTAPPGTGPVTDVLFTGATGFFGPFLLASLLAATPYTFHLLVRADDAQAAMQRVQAALARTAGHQRAAITQCMSRMRIVCGDLAEAQLDLHDEVWHALADRAQMIVHNAAAVNYVATYEALKPHNVEGTRTLLRLAATGRRKPFHHISSTFIFGWTACGLLHEHEHNAEMANLDFGYAQSKWVAEQLVLSAHEAGLPAWIYRPSLISVSTAGVGDCNDVAIRLLAFMIKHRVAVDTPNQVSLLAADVAADNIAAIIARGGPEPGTFHVTAERYYNMADITRLLTRDHGYVFTYFDIPGFIAEMNRRCTKADVLYPLLDFFNRSAPKIAAMKLKRYCNEGYRQARDRAGGRADPTLADTVGHLVSYLRAQGLAPRPHRAVSDAPLL